MTMSRCSRCPRPGITLFQLLVVLALLAFLLGLLLPAVARLRGQAARMASLNNLKQLGLAAHSFHDVYKEFPPIVGAFPRETASTGTLHFYLLPYLEQQAVYQGAHGSVWKNDTVGIVIPVFQSPNDKTVPPKYRHQNWLATTNYAGNWMVFKKGGTHITSITDGTSNTMMFAERYQLCHETPCGWGYASLYYWAPVFGYFSYGKFQQQPTQQACDPALPQALEPAGINVGMCDGSVHTISSSVNPRTWWLATDPNDGEVLLDFQ
jgi:hypothetical protein